MTVQFLHRNIFQRIFGIPATPKPTHPDCWRFADGRLTVDLAKAPELSQPGGALRIEGGHLPFRVLVTVDESGRYHAFHNRCTHLGHRRLDPVPGTGTVQCCSVNKSTYDMTGTKIYGPTPEPIRTFPVETAEGRLVIAIR